jgi:capsular polysaccharide biosynthesis protein
LEQLPGGIPVIFHATEPIGNITGKSAQQALLPALGIVPDRLLSADMIIAVGHLLVPWPYMEIRRKLHVLFLEYMKAAADSIVGQSSSPSQKIYLSRRKLEMGLRSITNELEIEEIFVQAGFAVVFPEEMSFVEQVGLFRAAGTVAGFVGSAFHNLIFCPGPKQVIYLSAERKINSNILMIDKAREDLSLFVMVDSRILRRTASETALFEVLDLDQIRAVAREEAHKS